MSSNLTNTPQAVVIPEWLQNTKDILPATTNLLSQTEYPFGVSITTNQGIPSETNLIYVTKQAALDRAPGKHPSNGGGVLPGWYIIAKPTYFQIKVTRLHNIPFPSEQRNPFDDAFSLAILVDGQDTHQRRIFVDSDDTQSLVFTGFVKKRTRTGGRVRKTVLRPFAFEKVSAVEDGYGAGDDVGVLRLRVRSGRLVYQSSMRASSTSYQYDDTPINEKRVAKEGRSIHASQNVDTLSYTSELSPYVVKSKVEIQQAGITIYVRERSWLHSRRIIDDDDQPVSYEKFLELLEADKPNVKHVGAVDVDEEPLKKRPRIKEQLLTVDEIQPLKPGEVIDLT